MSYALDGYQLIAYSRLGKACVQLLALAVGDGSVLVTMQNQNRRISGTDIGDGAREPGQVRAHRW